MSSNDFVLIVSTVVDAATDEVVRRLSARSVPHFRINTEEYPFANDFSYRPAPQGGDGPFMFGGRPLPSPKSIWYRRVRVPGKPQEMDQGVYEFCLQEQRAALVGSVMGHHGVRWMSHPAAVWQAEFKPLQLELAARLGLAIPKTIITNDPASIRTAFDEFGCMIVKPVRTGHVNHNGKEYSIYTSRVLKDHLDELDSARWSPAIYQELVPKQCDVRITIVGERCFAAAIDSQSDPAASVDWRRTNNPHLPHRPVTLPVNLTDVLHRLMNALGLTFGAIDMIQTPDGRFVFLEVNPSGQWLWIDDMLDLGISDAVAAWLQGASFPCS